MKILVLFVMLFCHVVDDFYLQGKLAEMKQRSWWEKVIAQSTSTQEANIAWTRLYRYDYLMALSVHAFSWAFMISLPALVYMFLNELFFEHLIAYVSLFVVNWLVHIFVDNAKANLKTINLVTDQFIHFIQVIVTWVVMFIIL